MPAHDESTVRSRPFTRSVLPLWKDQSGATAVEYALMLAAIAAVIIGTVAVLGVQVNGLFSSASDAWPN